MSITSPYREGMTSLDSIAMTIDREGFEALDRHVIDDVLTLASTAHASPVLTEVLGDEHEPTPVRERAFGLLAMQISSAASPYGPTTRSRRSRVPVPASGADSRSNWPVEVPVLR